MSGKRCDKKRKKKGSAIVPALLLAGILAGVLVFAPGCKTISKPVGPAVSPERVQAVSKLAAFVTARVAHIQGQEEAWKLDRVREVACLLRSQETWDLTALAAAAQAAGAPVFTSEEGTLIFTGSQLFVDAVLGVTIDLSKEPYLKAVIVGVCEGLNLANSTATAESNVLKNRLKAEAVQAR